MTTRLEFGDVMLDRVIESEDPLLSPYELYPDFTADVLDQDLSWLKVPFYDQAAERLVIPIQSFVVRMAGLTVLVDTCVGDHKARVRDEFDGAVWSWLDHLAAIGVRPEDVDVVICSHLHVDHVGWNTRLRDGRWVPTFPNARYVFSRAEWEYWKSAEGRAAMIRTGDYVEDSVLPIVEAGRADLVDLDHRFNDRLWFEPLTGHTPGHVAVHAADAGTEIVLSGDVMHHPMQLRYPGWSTRFCADPDRSRATRTAFLERCAGSETIVMPAHFPGPNCGRIVREGDHYGIRFLDAASAAY